MNPGNVWPSCRVVYGHNNEQFLGQAFWTVMAESGKEIAGKNKIKDLIRIKHTRKRGDRLTSQSVVQRTTTLLQPTPK